MAKEITILLVDDEADFTGPMSYWLNAKGYSVRVVPDGQAAINLIKRQKPDIVFLDFNIPVMDGIATLAKIREFDKELPVVIISAYVDDLKVKEVESYGISGVFYKGDDFEKGLSLLESILKNPES